VTIAGTYLFYVGAQFQSVEAAYQHVNLWIRKNGVDVAGSNRIFGVIPQVAGVPSYLVANASFYIVLATSDYIQLLWSPTIGTITIQPYAATTIPSAASVNATLTFLST
jgi:hypothetical protein